MTTINLITRVPFYSLIGLYLYALFEGLLKAVEIAVLGNPMPILIITSALALTTLFLLKVNSYKYGE